ncbi:glutathione S-transferase [Salipiger aestuarii]|uniref:Glutathione S-transferase n=1 Tax=Salipiger aestuarii TaxID=568098 RepID=A0A327Y6Y0_9RHOB|nr:glutathione S-transferase family protein [Salipiger aestuarii]EIE51910.1 glutathione S-transferase domain protein [Citreicella sp. 357]KAA8608344.1 glutathione S-transferase [Salipiger aestuarii]KAA8612901.1 glutathione S-transferase [Salipiger aestuarii]KAB2542189.1 glutathione S-transferase [Salipiger aestuarii]RAK16840.1 glutathione S-transferase [Salipiger aestuarii]
MIRLHHVAQSRSMRVLWLLHELGLPVEVVPHSFDRSLRTAEYLALSPAGRVPALELDGTVMFESLAMMEYLCERHPGPLWRAPGTPERADWLSWLHFSETISHHCATLTQQHIILRDDHMRSPIVMQLEARRLGKCYAALDARLDGRDHLLGAFSAVDVAVGQAVYTARHFAALDGVDRVAGWYDRITARPGFAASLPGTGARLYEREFYPAWDN